MEINLNSFLSRKELKSLQCSWPSLLNKKDYFIPKNVEDLKENLFSEIKIQNATYFFTKRLKDKLRIFVLIIYNNPLINEILCYDSIYKSVTREISTSLNSTKKTKFEYAINSISTNLSTKIDNHLYYFPLSGFTLVGIKKISVGEVTIESFDEKNLSDILERSVIIHKNKQFTDAVRCLISEHFIRRSIIIVPSYGDRTKTEQIVREKTKIIVNYFRFITCLLDHKIIEENFIKISIESAWPSKNDPFFYVTQNETKLSLADDIGRRPLQSFELTEMRLCDLKNNGFFDDLGEFIFKKEKTKLEICILTAIYWIGEAQNDYDRESSFLKYWTALESIFTNPKERKPHCEQAPKITLTLCKSVSVILAFSGYAFIDEIDMKTTFKELDRLYDARSNIVHNGAYATINTQELTDICKFSSWTVLCLFCLRKDHSISSISEIRAYIDKKYCETK